MHKHECTNWWCNIGQFRHGANLVISDSFGAVWYICQFGYEAQQDLFERDREIRVNAL